MAGFFEHFEQERVQIIGTVEYTYLNHMPEEHRHEHYRQFLSYNIPCVVFCRDFQPEEEFLKLASANGCLLYTSQWKVLQSAYDKSAGERQQQIHHQQSDGASNDFI